MSGDDFKPFRNAPRARVALQVRFGGGHQEAPHGGAKATTRDVAPGGAFLRTSHPLEPGMILTLSLEIADGAPPLAVEAEVKWCTPADAQEAGAGVQFVSPSPELKRRIEALQEADALPILELY